MKIISKSFFFSFLLFSGFSVFFELICVIFFKNQKIEMEFFFGFPRDSKFFKWVKAGEEANSRQKLGVSDESGYPVKKPARQLDFTGGSDEMLLTQIL